MHRGVLSRVAMLALVGIALVPTPIQLANGQESAAQKPEAQRLPAQDLTQEILYGLLIAEIALQRGNAGIAAQAFLDLARKTRDPRIARRAAEVAGAARMQTFAIDAARVWVDVDAGSDEAVQTLAVLLLAARRADEAEPFFARLFSTSTANAANGFMQIGRVLASNPDKAANLRLVQRLAGRFADLPQARFAVAQAAVAADDEALALQEIRRAASLRPDWETAALFEAQLLARKSPAEAGGSLGAFLDRNPNANDARLNYARLLFAERRDAEARQQLGTLTARNPKNPDVIRAAGLLAFQAREFALAESSFESVLALAPRSADEMRFLLGQVAEERKQWLRAIDWYRQVQDGEQAMQARVRTAHAMAKNGRVDEARQYLRRLEAEDAQQGASLLVAEAQILREANRIAEAFDVLSKGLETDPDQAELLYDHALTAEKLERFDVFEASLQKLIRLRPDNAHAHNALGYSFADRNVRLPEARKLLERAVQLAPDDFYIIDSLGWVLFRQGDLEGALKHLRRAFDGRPDGEIGAHLGEVLWRLGRQDEARQVWAEAQRLAPENETLQKTLKRFPLITPGR